MTQQIPVAVPPEKSASVRAEASFLHAFALGDRIAALRTQWFSGRSRALASEAVAETVHGDAADGEVQLFCYCPVSVSLIAQGPYLLFLNFSHRIVPLTGVPS